MAVRRPLPRPLWPTAIEERYRLRLVRRTTAAKRLLDEALLGALRRILPDLDADARADSADPTLDETIATGIACIGITRLDSAASDLASLLRVVETTRRAFTTAYAPAAEGLTTLGGQLALFTTKQVDKSYPSLAAIAVGKTPTEAAAVKAWAGTNAKLIKSIDARYFDDIRDVVSEAVKKGTQTREISALLRERYSVSKSRAELIARDQVAKLNSKITEAKQTRLGITKYVWSSSRDERVRPTHRNLDGTIQEWATAPVSEENGDRNHPGMAVRCRCVALPRLDDDEDTAPTRFVAPTLTAGRPTIYGSREKPLTAEESADLKRRLGRKS